MLSIRTLLLLGATGLILSATGSVASAAGWNKMMRRQAMYGYSQAGAIGGNGFVRDLFRDIVQRELGLTNNQNTDGILRAKKLASPNSEITAIEGQLDSIEKSLHISNQVTPRPLGTVPVPRPTQVPNFFPN